MKKIWSAMKFAARVIKVYAIVSVCLWVISVALQIMISGFSLLTNSKKK